MSTLRVVYHLARADFLERVRRYSFLVMLGLVIFLGYQVAIDNLSLELGQYRGEFNSAWVGAMMSLIASFFIGWFGFYIVKGSVARDRETGVGQIIATTPLTRPLYMIGKCLSNFCVLMAMVVVLVLAGIVIQLLQGEDTQINVVAYLDPFVFIVLPLMTIIAAIAVLFEAISFLQGGFGNIVYFFAFILFLPLFMENSTLNKHLAFEPTGLGLMSSEMGKAVTAINSAYDGDFTLGSSGTRATELFTWSGIHWTSETIFARFTLIAFAIGLTFLAALFFDRFDPSHRRQSRRKSRTPFLKQQPSPALAPGASVDQTQGKRVSTSQALPQSIQLTRLTASLSRFTFSSVLISELKLLLKGQRWWWYTIAGGLILASIFNTAAITREIILPIAWVWPILIWSSIGNREIKHNVQQMAFSSPSPIWRQIPAQWQAGFILTITIAVGAILRLGLDGDLVGLLALLSGAIFIPSLALACGVWSGGSKLFEILYILIWYLGPLNRVPILDYIGVTSDSNPVTFLIASIFLVAFAIVGRTRQVRN